MDLDAYSAAHRDEWDRLRGLARRRVLTGRQADDLIAGYQSGAAQLAQIKTQAGSSVEGDRLSVLLSRARMRFTGTAANPLTRIPAFFVLDLPAALYRLRWLTLAVAVVTVVVGGLFAAWALADPQVLANFGTDENLKRMAEHDFVDYYSENPAASFAGQVWTNNAWIAAQCIAFGVLGLYVPVVVLQNAMNVGVAAAVMTAYGRADVFVQYILPHGMLELTSIFVAAAAGIRIFWAWVAPGPRTRAQALAEDGRALFTVAIGLAISLFVSGIIEAFVTPAPWPWPVKIGIGALALAAFLVYQLVLGRRAAQLGVTGDLGEFEAGPRRLVAG